MESPWTAASSERARRLAVDRMADGYPPAEAAEFLRVGERSVWRWVAAVRSAGTSGPDPKPGRGRPPKLSPAGATPGFLGRSPAGFALRHRAVDGPAGRAGGRAGGRRADEPPVPERLTSPPRGRHAAGARDPRPGAGREAGIARWLRRGWPRVKQRRATATRTSCSPTSAASRRCRWPTRRWPSAGTPRPAAHALFLRTLARQVRGPLVLVHDGGGMHKGPAVRAVEGDHPGLSPPPVPGVRPGAEPGRERVKPRAGEGPGRLRARRRPAAGRGRPRLFGAGRTRSKRTPLVPAGHAAVVVWTDGINLTLYQRGRSPTGT